MSSGGHDDGEDSASARQLGILASQEGRWPEAVEHWDRGLRACKAALTHRPDAVDEINGMQIPLLANLALGHLKCNAPLAARDAARQLLLLSHDHPKGLYRKALAEIDLGLYQEARETAQRLRSLEPKAAQDLLNRVRNVAPTAVKYAPADDESDEFEGNYIGRRLVRAVRAVFAASWRAAFAAKDLGRWVVTSSLFRRGSQLTHQLLKLVGGTMSTALAQCTRRSRAFLGRYKGSKSTKSL